MAAVSMSGVGFVLGGIEQFSSSEEMLKIMVPLQASIPPKAFHQVFPEELFTGW